MAVSSARRWVPNTHRIVGLRPIAEAPLDGREVLVTDGVYWRVAIPKLLREGIWEYHRDDANCPGHTWSCAPTHFILIEDLPQVAVVKSVRADYFWGGYTFLQTVEDMLWLDEGMRKRWRLRRPARAFWRLWGVRHLRYAFHMVRVWHWDRQFEKLDIGPIGYEAWVGYAIKRGWV